MFKFSKFTNIPFFSLGSFGTPRSTLNNDCYTPKRIDEAKQREINYLTSKEIIEKIDKPRISQKFDMPILENMDLEDEESVSAYRAERNNFIPKGDVGIKSNAPEMYEFDNSIPSEVEDMVTENSISSTIQCIKTDLLKDFAVKKQISILDNDNSTFGVFDETISLKKLDFHKTVKNSTDNDVCIIVSQGKTVKKVAPLNNELEYYVNKAEMKKQITSIKDKNKYHCTIDRNLEIALKNAESKEFSLDQLIVSPAGNLLNLYFLL